MITCLNKIMRCLKILFLIGAAVLLCQNAQAAEKRQYVYPKAFDGRLWHGLDNISEEHSSIFKVCLLRGIYEGAYSADKENAFELYGPWISFGELATALDAFYAEKKNEQISITYALVLLARQSLEAEKFPPASPTSRAGNMLVSRENSSR